MTIQFPQVDWTTLIPNLVSLFFNALGKWLSNSIRATFSGLWGSDANVLTNTPMDMIWTLGPISTSIADIQTAARAVLILAAILLGLRGMLGAMVPNQTDMLGEFVNGILVTAILIAAFPIFVPELITLTNNASKAIALGAMSGFLTIPGAGATDPIGLLIITVVLIFFGFRLIVKTIWRVGFLAVMLPIGMAAALLYALPPTRWILGWWARVWGGMLLAQIPSTLALAIGLAFVASASGTLGGFVYSIAFLQLAHDLYDLIPFGMARGQGSVLGAAGMAFGWARIGAAALSGGGAAAAATPLGIRPQLAADMAGHSPRYGYD